MSTSFTQKTSRVLQLLLGLRYPDVAAALQAFGFDDKEADQGWELLRAMGKARGRIVQPVVNAKIIQQLDAWENLWFPIAQATLTHRCPAVAQKMFQNLTQVSGREVAITVQMFVDRYDDLDQQGSDFGPEGATAKAVLAARGLTEEAMGEVKALLEELRHTAATPDAIEHAKEDAAKAEEALWAWYLEWSQVVRSTIKNRWLLHQLGFLTSSGATADDEAPESGADGATGTATAPAAS
jgi:hypothetical protein